MSKILEDLRDEIRTLQDTAEKFKALCTLAERAYLDWKSLGHGDSKSMWSLWMMLRQIERAPLGPPRGVFQVVDRPRGGGKTTEMVKQTILNGGVLIVAHEHTRKNILSRYPALKDDQVLSWHSARVRLRGHSLQKPNGRLPIFIDDADYILSEQLGRHIDGISVSL